MRFLYVMVSLDLASLDFPQYGGRALRGLLEPGRIQWRSGALLDSLVAAELEVLLGSRWVGGRWLWC